MHHILPHVFNVFRNTKLYLGGGAVPHRENVEMPLLHRLVLKY